MSSYKIPVSPALTENLKQTWHYFNSKELKSFPQKEHRQITTSTYYQFSEKVNT